MAKNKTKKVEDLEDGVVNEVPADFDLKDAESSDDSVDRLDKGYFHVVADGDTFSLIDPKGRTLESGLEEPKAQDKASRMNVLNGLSVK